MTETKKKNTGSLPLGTILRNGQYQYRIEEVLGQGNYGITYKASAMVKIGNISKPMTFAVKENFARDYCSRKTDGVTLRYTEEHTEEAERDLREFIAEGKTLERICHGHENIVNVNETFEENNTAYYVMEFIEGGDLKSLVCTKGRLTETEAISIISPIIDAVAHIHRNRRLHLDIKPENIVLKKDGTPILIDFGITLHFNADGSRSGTSKDKSGGFSKGYAPLEQYAGVDKFAPEIDVYALGATLYYMLVGKDPDKAASMSPKQIEATLPQDISIRTKKAILHAMKPMSEERTPTATAFKNELYSTSGPSDTIDSYRLIVRHNGKGKIFRNNKELRSGSSYKVKKDTQKAVTIIPDEGFLIDSVKLNNREVKGQLSGNALLLNKQEGDVSLVVNFTNLGTKKIEQKEVTIKASGNGCIANGIVSVRNYLRTLRVNSGSSFTISITPDVGHHVKRLMVNNNSVTSRINNNRYTINAISNDTVIDAVFEKDEEIVSPVSEPNNYLRNILIATSAFLFIVGLVCIIDYSNRIAVESEEQAANVEYVTNYGVAVNSADSLIDYTGSLVDGIPNDHNATIQYADNDEYGRNMYVGGIENGMRVDTSATLTYRNGDKYVGSFIDDNYGEGTYYIGEDGSYFKGTFKRDMPYNGAWYYKSGAKMSDVVNGIEK